MTGNDVEIGINQYRHIEAEAVDAAGDLPDLLFAMNPGVGWIGLEQIDRTKSYIEGGFERAPGALARCKVGIQRKLSLRRG